MNRDLHQLEVKDGHIFLDGMMLKGITDFNLVHEEGRMFPELTLKMDVRTLPRSTTKNTDGREGESSKEVLEKTRKKKRLCPACFVGLPEKANYQELLVERFHRTYEQLQEPIVRFILKIKMQQVQTVIHNL